MPPGPAPATPTCRSPAPNIIDGRGVSVRQRARDSTKTLSMKVKRRGRRPFHRASRGPPPPLSWGRKELRPPHQLLRLGEVAVALHRRAHQEAVAFLDDALGVAGLDVRMADHHVVLLAG